MSALRCNPGSIVKSSIRWVGQSERQDDSRFVCFTAPQFGIRAIAVLLLAYYRKHGLNTVRGLIERWAPPSENDTAAYVADVAQRCKLAADGPVKVDDPLILAKLVSAIIWHETGENPYVPQLIANAVDAALERDNLIGQEHP